MPEHHHYEDDDLFNPETKHEESDVPLGPLFWGIAGIIVFAIVSHILLYLFYQGLRHVERKREPPPQTAIARPPDANVPQNQPLLQPFPRKIPGGEIIAPNRATPEVDLVDMRRGEEQVLQNYGWVDKQKGVVHIPIDAAKDLAVQRLATAAPHVPLPANAGIPAAAQTHDTGVPPPAATTTNPAVTNTTGGTPQ
jgi:hypothetical protein